MTWEAFYLGCFVLGLVLCALSLITGGGHIHGGHFHLGSHTHAHSSHASSKSGAGGGVSAINGFTITAFLCWFGGIGYLLRTHTSVFAPLALLISVVGGLAGAALIFWFLTSVLLPRDRSLTTEETEITGVIGTVSGPISDGATGEIIYTQLDTRRSSPARSEDGIPIDRGAEVIVLRYDRGIAYVRAWHDMDL